MEAGLSRKSPQVLPAKLVRTWMSKMLDLKNKLDWKSNRFLLHSLHVSAKIIQHY